MTKIEWVARPGTTPETWNPITGCTKISEGCAHCYAERMARRLAGRYGYPEAPSHFDVTLHPDRLEEPSHWRKPRTVFVCSMSDLFHEDVPIAYIWRVIETAWKAKAHTFMILTKRPERMFDVLTRSLWWMNDTPQNIWLGVTAENQKRANERIPVLLDLPAVVRFVSLEPLLCPIDIPWYYACDLDWVIVGGESGPGARPMHPDWVRLIRDQCQAVRVPFFFKQWGAWIKSRTVPGDDWSKVTFMDLSGKMHKPTNGLEFWHVGKKRAGRLLDGREWNEWPEASRQTSCW